LLSPFRPCMTLSFSYCAATPPHLRSFPTRRSSDLKRIGDEEFEFAGLVPAFSQPQPVIPFDPDLRAAELGGEARQMLQRRRSVDVAATRNLLKVDHGTRVYS